MSLANLPVEDLERIVLFLHGVGEPFWQPRSNGMFVEAPVMLPGFLCNVMVHSCLAGRVGVRPEERNERGNVVRGARRIPWTWAVFWQYAWRSRGMRAMVEGTRMTNKGYRTLNADYWLFWYGGSVQFHHFCSSPCPR